MSVSITNNSSGFILVSGATELNNGDNTIVLKLPDNYIIVNNPYLRIQYISYYQDYQFTQSGNFFELTIQNVDILNIIRADLYGDCEEDTQLVSDFPTIRCYSVDKTKMNSLMNERFYRLSTNDYIDLAQYILNYIRFPFAIEKTDSDNIIVLGYVSTQTQTKLCKNQLYEIEIFNSLVLGETDTSNDIKNSEIVFELPFIARKTIDSKYINTVIKIVYKTDILTNKTTVLFYSNDVLIDSVDTIIGYNIPYTLKYDEIKSFNNNFNNNLNKNINPKLTVLYHSVIENTKDNPTYKVDYLKNYVGKLWIKEIKLTWNKYKTDEKEILKNLFANGVIIKNLHNVSCSSQSS